MVAVRDLLDAAADVIRPLEPFTPSEFAERYRVVVGGPFAGRWDNANGPHLTDVMDAVKEAIETGRHLVVMKGAQEGVTEALGVNAVAWLLTYYGGPVLYLTSKDDVARELARDRWDHVLDSLEPLKKKHLAGKVHGELILTKRFTDAKLVMSGSKSLLNFLSAPFAVVVFDEIDSCQDEMPDGSDPIALVLERLTAFAEGRPVLLIAFAHPTTKERGAGKLYYQLSDQRRGHVQCPHCGQWIAPLWPHVRVHAREGQPPAIAERDPTCYEFVAPCCGVVWSDADRLRAIQKVEQRPTIPAELARTREWIGLHTWHVFLRKGGQVKALARKCIEGFDDEGKAVVWQNKVCGDVLEVEDEDHADEDAWRACITLPRFDGDPASYYRGDVPREVSVLLGSTDSGERAFHWNIWGFGFLPVYGGGRVLCAWLIDWGEVKRDPPSESVDAADLRVFDEILYKRRWPIEQGRERKVSEVAHDTGWSPNGHYDYVAKWPWRAIAIKGGSDDESSAAPLLRWGKRPNSTRAIKGLVAKDLDDRLGIVNTWAAKKLLHSRVLKRFKLDRGDAGPPELDRWRLHLPIDVEDEVIRHLCAERLVKKGRRREWIKTGPNHYGDCAVYALALAETLAKLQGGRTAKELDAGATPAPVVLERAQNLPARRAIRPERIRREY